MSQRSPATPRYSIALSADGGAEQLPVIIRKHRRSRRIVIRYQPLAHALSLTLPRYVTIRQGLHFVEEKRSWIEHQVQMHARRIPFCDGQSLPILGKDYMLRHQSGRGLVRIEEGCIVVPGEESFMARRVREWVKKIARHEITRQAKEKAEKIGRPLKRISLRDTTSRWGSCSSTGSLSFSWRLVFAPPEVLDYIVCHEVAHIRHHNHGPRFWKLVAELCPGHEEAQRWLKEHGPELYAYG